MKHFEPRSSSRRQTRALDRRAGKSAAALNQGGPRTIVQVDARPRVPDSRSIAPAAFFGSRLTMVWSRRRDDPCAPQLRSGVHQDPRVQFGELQHPAASVHGPGGLRCHPAWRSTRASRDPRGPGSWRTHPRSERHEGPRVPDEPCSLAAAGGYAPGWRAHSFPATQMGPVVLIKLDLPSKGAHDDERYITSLGDRHLQRERGNASVIGDLRAGNQDGKVQHQIMIPGFDCCIAVDI